MHFLMVWSLLNFAHATTAVLLWHVKNSIRITPITFSMGYVGLKLMIYSKPCRQWISRKASIESVTRLVAIRDSQRGYQFANQAKCPPNMLWLLWGGVCKGHHLCPVGIDCLWSLQICPSTVGLICKKKFRDQQFHIPDCPLQQEFA